MRPVWIKRIATTLTLLSFTSLALAQYVWLDDKGVKQYSDMPPPASVPQKQILKQPGRSYSASQTSNDSSSDASSAAKSASSSDESNMPMTIAEKNAEFQKRRAKQAEQEAKAAAEAKIAANKAKNCENARNYYRSLTTGERIAATDKNGERTFLEDDQRAKEVKDMQNTLNDCK
ncbi:MAG TPA: DUF4124 domain-containing protein [Burkholderiaceae bacterium]|jgi:hypothetical protein